MILAAGNATRMHPVSEYMPKGCLPVGPRMILEHQLEYLRLMRIETVHIVIGHKHQEVYGLLGDGGKYSMEITYHIQDRRLGIAHALSLVKGRISGPFILLLGDIFFPSLDLMSMYQEYCRHSANGVLAASIEENFDVLRKNYSIESDKRGFVTRVVEKPDNQVNNLKGAGAYIFDDEIFSVLDSTPRSKVRGEVELTGAIQLFIQRGARVRYAVCVEDDENISTPSDLLRVNMDIIKKSNSLSLVAEDHKLGRSVSLKNVVIGRSTVIEDDVNLENCVVLPKSVVRKGDSISNAIYYKTDFVNV